MPDEPEPNTRNFHARCFIAETPAWVTPAVQALQMSLVQACSGPSSACSQSMETDLPPRQPATTQTVGKIQLN
jgi:hypothetical protein